MHWFPVGSCLRRFLGNHTLLFAFFELPVSLSHSRHVVQDFLEGEDRRNKHDELRELVNEEGYNLISVVREPLDQFYSSYDEAVFTTVDGRWKHRGG